MNHYVVGDFVRDLRDDTYGIIESFSTRTGFARIQWRKPNGNLLRPSEPVFNSDPSDFNFTYATPYKVGDVVTDPYQSRGAIQRFERVTTLWCIWANWFNPKTRKYAAGYRMLRTIQ